MNNNDDLLKDIESAARAVQRSNGSSINQQQYDFAMLGEKIADSLVQAAEDQVAQATQKLEEVRAFADTLRAQINEKNNELADMNSRLKSFGESILDAHRKFNETAAAVITQGKRLPEPPAR